MYSKANRDQRKVPLTASVPIWMCNALDDYCDKNRTRRSWVVREILGEFLKEVEDESEENNITHNSA
jgi:metal-responsive CopG/Arc/MetJ family transcriptional regulator